MSDIANTILAQIGGKALFMMGAKDKIAIENGVQFKIRGSKVANTIKVVLDPSDTYTVTFMKYSPIRVNRKTLEVSGGTAKVVKEFDSMYAEDLTRIIGDVTGLATSL